MSNFTPEHNETSEITVKGPQRSYEEFDLVIISVKGFSAVCLFTLIIIYVRRREHKALAGKNVISLSACLIATHILDTVNILLENMIPTVPCLIISVLTNFLFFSSFVWVSAMSFDIMRTITCMKSTRSIDEGVACYIKYSVGVWLIALGVYIPAVVIDYFRLLPEVYRPNFGNPFCDFNSRWAIAIFFDAPAALTVVANIILFIITVRAILQIKKLAAELDIKQQKQRFGLYIKLVIVMGIVRIAMFLEWFYPNKDNLYITAVPDCLYGFFIFLIFALKIPPWNKMKKHFLCWCLSKKYRSGTSMNEASSDTNVTEVTESSSV